MRGKLVLNKKLLSLTGVLLLAMLIGASVPIIPTDLFLGAAGIVIAFVLMASVDTTSLLLSMLILSTGVSMSFWLDYRVMIGPFPLSAPDAIIAVYGFYGFSRWLREHRRRSIGPIGFIIATWLAYYSLAGLVVGIGSGNPIYAVLQEYRLVLYTTIAYFTTLVVFRPERHLPIVVLSLIATGFMVCAWQAVITVATRGQMAADEAVYVYEGVIFRSGRDPTLLSYFAAFGLIFLVVSHTETRGILGMSRRWIWVLAPILMVVPFFSVTRTTWFSMIISSGMLLLYLFFTNLHNRRVLHVMLLFCVFLIVLLGSYTLLQLLLPTTLESMRTTWDYTLSAEEDVTRKQRIDIPLRLLNYLFLDASDTELTFGLGFGNMWSGATSIGPFRDIHSVYLAYMVIGGVIGLLIFLTLWISLGVAYFRVLSRTPDDLTRAYVISSVMSYIVFSVLMFAMPPHWTESAWLGLTLGIASILTEKNAPRFRVSSACRSS